MTTPTHKAKEEMIENHHECYETELPPLISLQSTITNDSPRIQNHPTLVSPSKSEVSYNSIEIHSTIEECKVNDNISSSQSTTSNIRLDRNLSSSSIINLSTTSTGNTVEIDGMGIKGYLTMREDGVTYHRMKTYYCRILGVNFYRFSSSTLVNDFIHATYAGEIVDVDEWDGKGLWHTYKNAFKIIFTNGVVFNTYTDSNQTKLMWIDYIRSALNAIVQGQMIWKTIEENQEENLLTPGGLTFMYQDKEKKYIMPKFKHQTTCCHPNCGVRFDSTTTGKREHHCRNCGGTVCSVHSPRFAVLRHYQINVAVRLCLNCFRAQRFALWLSMLVQRLLMYKKTMEEPSLRSTTLITKEEEDSVVAIEILFKSSGFGLSDVIQLLHLHRHDSNVLYDRIVQKLLELGQENLFDFEFFIPQIFHIWLTLDWNTNTTKWTLLFRVLNVAALLHLRLATAVHWLARAAVDDSCGMGFGQSEAYIPETFSRKFSMCKLLLINLEVLIHNKQEWIVDWTKENDIIAVEPQQKIIEDLFQRLTILLYGSPSNSDSPSDLKQATSTENISLGLICDSVSRSELSAVLIPTSNGNSLSMENGHGDSDTINIEPSNIHRLGTLPSTLNIEKRGEDEILLYTTQLEFIRELCEMTERLRHFPPPERRNALKEELQNLKLPSSNNDEGNAVYPLGSCREPLQKFVSIARQEGTVFTTRARAPTLVFFEVQKLLGDNTMGSPWLQQVCEAPDYPNVLCDESFSPEDENGHQDTGNKIDQDGASELTESEDTISMDRNENFRASIDNGCMNGMLRRQSMSQRSFINSKRNSKTTSSNAGSPRNAIELATSSEIGQVVDAMNDIRDDDADPRPDKDNDIVSPKEASSSHDKMTDLQDGEITHGGDSDLDDEYDFETSSFLTSQRRISIVGEISRNRRSGSVTGFMPSKPWEAVVSTVKSATRGGRRKRASSEGESMEDNDLLIKQDTRHSGFPEVEKFTLEQLNAIVQNLRNSIEAERLATGQSEESLEDSIEVSGGEILRWMTNTEIISNAAHAMWLRSELINSGVIKKVENNGDAENTETKLLACDETIYRLPPKSNGEGTSKRRNSSGKSRRQSASRKRSILSLSSIRSNSKSTSSVTDVEEPVVSKTEDSSVTAIPPPLKEDEENDHDDSNEDGNERPSLIISRNVAKLYPSSSAVHDDERSALSSSSAKNVLNAIEERYQPLVTQKALQHIEDTLQQYVIAVPELHKLEENEIAYLQENIQLLKEQMEIVDDYVAEKQKKRYNAVISAFGESFEEKRERLRNSSPYVRCSTRPNSKTFRDFVSIPRLPFRSTSEGLRTPVERNTLSGSTFTKGEGSNDGPDANYDDIDPWESYEWDCVAFVVKSNDDLRQEVLCLQLIRQMQDIFTGADLPLRLLPYGIISTSASTGIIEYIKNATSLDALKGRKGYTTLADHFIKMYGPADSDTYKAAMTNYVRSMAAYSLACYFLQIKDRHNGNIMLDRDGYIVHIDFGFILGIAPGGAFTLETAPFKLTSEMVKAMGGTQSEYFKAYVIFLIQGFLALQQHADTLLMMVAIMAHESSCPCFLSQTPKDLLSAFKQRFRLELDQNDVIKHVLRLVKRSHNSYRTWQYDLFQKMTNGILP